MTATKNAGSEKFAVELRKIDDIRPYERNPRINDQAVDAVAASLKEFGFRQPIVIDADGVIIAGHTRWKAARKLGLAKVPVHVATDLSPEQVKAYRIADNKSGELAEWDLEILPIELAELRDGGFDMQLLAFDQEELSKLLDGDVQQGLTDPDEVPAPPDEAITKPGDLYILGNHRLLCGDSGSVEDLDRLLDGAPVHLVNTDPPYNVKVEPRSNNAIAAGLSSFEAPAPEDSGRRTGRKKSGLTHHQQSDVDRNGVPQATHRKLRAKDRPLANDFVSDEAFAQMLRAWFGNIARVLLPGHSAYIWGGYSNIANYPPALVEAGLYFSQMIIWDKLHPVLTRKDYMGAHEWCFYSWREGAAHRFFGPNNETDLWRVKKVTPQKMIHLTEKPVELAIRAIRNSSLQGENVLDLFGGSGSTLIACEQTGRKAFLMELDPLYCDVIVQRYEQFTGKKAERVPAAAPADRLVESVQ
ncbi:MAG: Modification methylase DpnIIB [Planctomycetes bacterium ADurb.Bin126]|nr:MAG: Modification methylase DpnIIB [Planctomycetes bacterium ADurb.Bin126]